ncbi:MAG: TIGR00645 family protein [Betaproteobacteria bacterium]|nr:TIGR00645 family protein [Betaproteobacteria bacterium]
MNEDKEFSFEKKLRPLPRWIFMSRWLQAPLYIGLIVAQGVYVWQFWMELVHLISMMKDKDLTETALMLVVLGLIDVVMISNLLVMVIVGGWETFVSRLDLQNHPDEPEWLSHVNAGVLKVKLATAIIGISSIHLLKTFINASAYDEKTLIWQTLIHVTFVLSAISIAYTEKIITSTYHKKHE